MGKILCIGEALIDMICTDKGQTLAAGEQFLKKPGGAPTNVAAAIAALGGQVALAAKVGNDPFGTQLISVMKSFGVDTQLMIKDDTYFTTLAFVSLMHSGDRDFVFNRGADGQLSIHDTAAIQVTDYNIIHFGSATGFLTGPLQLAYKDLFEKAINNKKFVCFDPNYRHLLFKHDRASFILQSWHFLNNCSFFKLSDEEALLLTNTTDISAATDYLLQHTTANFAITIGQAGTLLAYNKIIYSIPSIPIVATDTTGAGDAFVGALLYQLHQYNLAEINELTLAQWLQFIANANKAGARTCEYVGAMEAYKHLTNQIFN